METRVKAFGSETEDYHRAFQVFLDHTDQKHKAGQWLESFVEALPQKRVFLDAGAGNGKVTAWFSGRFRRTVALEPNLSLVGELRAACPGAEVHAQTILNAGVEVSADFILASHVFYYIPRGEWISNIARLASWLSPQGALVVMLQNAETDCMGMLKHFFKKSFDLRVLESDFKAAHGNRYEITMETVPSHIATSDFESAYAVAEFMMNLLPMPEPPARSELETYVRSNFSSGGGEYRFSCHQDFLVIRRRA